MVLNGDPVYFSEVAFSGRLYIKSSGAEDARILVSAYASGNRAGRYLNLPKPDFHRKNADFLQNGFNEPFRQGASCSGAGQSWQFLARARRAIFVLCKKIFFLPILNERTVVCYK